MKKLREIGIGLLAVFLLLALAGCGSSSAEEQETLTGTLDEMKDFMFVVTDSQNDSYAFSFDQNHRPTGLDDVTVGDRVTVTYTGTLSVVDSFTGTIVSVEKAS